MKQLRQLLRENEYTNWCSYPHKGKGVELFAEVPPANKWIVQKKGLTSSEWRDMVKMIGMVAPVRSLPGRSTSTTHCRHCRENETLPHVLGSCPQGALLRVKRRNVIRSILTNELRRKAFEVHEEVQCLAEDESTRRIDIIVFNRHKSEAEILDPTIRFERSSSQPREVDLEKKRIYEPTVPYFLEFYN